MNHDPIATYDATLMASLLGNPLSGQLTSYDSDSADPATFSQLGDALTGLSLNADGSFSFDPGDPAYASLGSGETQVLAVPYRVSDDFTIPQPALPVGVITVNPGQSIQAALDSAPSGSTIFVAAGIFSEDLTIRSDVTLLGSNHGAVHLNTPDPFSRDGHSGKDHRRGHGVLGASRWFHV